MIGKEFYQNLGCIGTYKVKVATKSNRLYLEGVDDTMFTLGRVYGPEGSLDLSIDDFVNGEVEVSSKDETLAFLKGRLSEDDINRF